MAHGMLEGDALSQAIERSIPRYREPTLRARIEALLAETETWEHLTVEWWHAQLREALDETADRR